MNKKQYLEEFERKNPELLHMLAKNQRRRQKTKPNKQRKRGL